MPQGGELGQEPGVRTRKQVEADLVSVRRSIAYHEELVALVARDAAIQDELDVEVFGADSDIVRTLRSTREQGVLELRTNLSRTLDDLDDANRSLRRELEDIESRRGVEGELP